MIFHSIMPSHAQKAVIPKVTKYEATDIDRRCSLVTCCAGSLLMLLIKPFNGYSHIAGVKIRAHRGSPY